MRVVVRTAGLTAPLLLASSLASAADQKQIEAAMKKGADWVKTRYAQGAVGKAGNHGIGPECLSGLALLEAGVPRNDPTVKALTTAIRDAAFRETKTYQASLCLMYLDRYDDPADVPLIQALAVRLLAGQGAAGGWGYDTVAAVSDADEKALRAVKADQPPGQLHPDIERYGRAVFAARAATPVGGGDDNSNTQFAVIAVWLARKHGVPVEDALNLIGRRYLASQNPRTGGWGYNGPAPGGGNADAHGSPSMHCAGLIGLATWIGRRDDARAKADPGKKDPPKGEPGGPPKNPGDPFFNPPAKPKDAEPKKNPPRAQDAFDRAADFGLRGLGVHLADSARAGGGALVIKSDGHGQHDLYFLWSVERVGVIFGLEKIGGVNWYEAGAHSLVRAQGADGSWGAGGYGAEVNTAFALLFLSKANLARGLNAKGDFATDTTLKTERPSGSDSKGSAPGGGAGGPIEPAPILPGPAAGEAATLAAQLILAAEKDWTTVLHKLRDAKGIVHTQALVTAVGRLDGDKRKLAREALAERLTRMTAKSLREMAKVEDAEWRRAALLAMAMKDDKGHIPDLIAAIEDEEDIVVRAARAGLRSLTGGEDFGPGATSTAGEKAIAAARWREWLDKQKK